MFDSLQAGSQCGSGMVCMQGKCTQGAISNGAQETGPLQLQDGGAEKQEQGLGLGQLAIMAVIAAVLLAAIAFFALRKIMN